jgi:hypothetical protein
MNQPMSFDWPAGRRWQRWLLLGGLVGAAVCALAAVLDLGQLLRSYLFAYFSWLGFALGSLALWMLHNLTGGAWGFVLRRIWEAATRTLPLLAVLFVPIALGVSVLFPWATGEHSDLGSKVDYLNVPFFLARAGFYFFVWIGMAFLLNRWSAQHDRTGDPALVDRASQLSGPGLVACGLTVTFAAVDWVMSLEPDWYSTIFGALVGMGYLLAALALAIAVATWVRTTRRLTELGSPASEEGNSWNDLGNLLLAFVMLWTYMGFSQFLLIWSGNLPEEIIWYLHRTEGGWQWIGLSLAIGYFAVPFCLLLAHDMKRNPDRLRVIAILVAGMSVVNDYWLIAPAFSPSQFHWHWMDLAALVAVGGLWLAFFLQQLQARPIMPIHETVAKEELHHA